MKSGRIALPLLLIIGLPGCVDLEAVRELASETAGLSAYTDLTLRFRDAYEREGDPPQRYDEAVKGIRLVAEGHRELLKNADSISTSEAKELISRCVRDIRAVRVRLASGAE